MSNEFPDPNRIRHQPRLMKEWQEALEDIGIDVHVLSDSTLVIQHKGKKVNVFPYTGWFTGKTVEDGRGLKKLLAQLNGVES